MITPAQIGYINDADAAALSSSSQILLAPVTRLQNPHVGMQWQALGGVEWFAVDFGANVPLDCVRLMNITADTIRLRYSTTSPDAGDVFDTGVRAVNQQFLTFTDLRGVSARYLRFDLASAGQCAAGRLFAGRLESFGINYAWNWTRKWTDPSDRTKTQGGQTRINRKPKFRTFSVNFDFLSDAESAGFTDDIDRINGMTDDVLFIANPASANIEQDSIWGLMTDLTPTAQQFIDIWTKQYTIEQRL